MVENSLDQRLDLPGYEQIGAESTLFENGDALDVHQKHASPNRLSVELAQALVRVDEQRQQEAAEVRKQPTVYEHLRRTGAWVIYMREEKLNKIQPVTQQEIAGSKSDHSLAA